MAALSSIAEVLERTAGRTIFTCMHAYTERRRYDDMCEICWDCRAVRGKHAFDTYWPPEVRIQHADGTMTTTDGRPKAQDWRIPPISRGLPPPCTQAEQPREKPSTSTS